MPSNIVVNYFLYGSNSLLGKETYEGITEVQVYKADPERDSVSLTRFFDGQAAHRWKIVDIQEVSPEEISFYITPRVDCLQEVFLSKTYRTNNTVKNGLLQRGTLVEVEYGYIKSARRHTGKLGSNKRYPDSVQHSEMNKRRLAIVVSTSYPTIQVIPITSVPQDLNNGAVFQVSADSVKDLHNYNNPAKVGYALAHMLQTVSIYRVLPPMGIFSKHGKVMRYRNVNYPHKLNRQDSKALEVAITTSVGAGDFVSIREERNHLRLSDAALREQLEARQSDLESLSHDIEVLRQRNNLMQMLLVDWQKGLKVGQSDEVALAAIEAELNNYREILNG